MDNKKIIKKFDIPNIDNALENGTIKINPISKKVLLANTTVSNFFLNLLKETYYNETEMALIKNFNICYNQAPVLTWILIKRDVIIENNMDDELRNNRSLKIAIGAFWGIVMKEKYGMIKGSKQNFSHTDKIFNFKAASRYRYE